MGQVIKFKLVKENNRKPLPSGFRYTLKRGRKEVFHSNLFPKKKIALREAKQYAETF